MKLEGYRRDGTLRIGIPGGLTVLLRGDSASPPMDDAEADRFGPWTEPPVALSWQERQDLAKRLDRSRVIPVQQFTLAKGKSADDTTAVDVPKGDLLAQIKAIADARAREKDAQAKEKELADAKARVPPPHYGKKRLKLEYEVEDRQGDEPKKDEKKDEPKKDKPKPDGDAFGIAPEPPVPVAPPPTDKPPIALRSRS